MNEPITMQLNGTTISWSGSPQRRLLDLLRDDRGLQSVREGCGVGMCGACTVQVDGQAISSCLLLTGQVAGRQVRTIEGIGTPESLHPIQQAFIDHAAFQCGYCTPGFILTVEALLREIPAADEATIREYLSGNLCRCGSYNNILAAVKALQSGNYSPLG
jgi:aerobic-type carbon monoxide dehydrogenase small subunit (CoxS/CutS family)